MAKVALLIGVSVYEPGLSPLPGAINDVDAMQQVLVRPDIGDFVDSDITVLKNPNRQKMEEEIERLFANRQKNDLILLFYSGHGIKDDFGKLYLATCHTSKNSRGELIRSSAVSANFVHENMERSRSKRQVVMLDSCFSGAFADGLSAKDDGAINIHEQLGGEGRAILTSSSSTQYSFGSNQEGSELSIYTRYLIEGMMTGAADLDEDGIVSIDELHEYASKKVREIQPAMKPMIYAIREGFKIKLTKVPPGDPKEKYCKEVKGYISRGELTFIGRKILDALRIRYGMSDAEATEIENKILAVARQEFRDKLQHYERDFAEAIQQEKPLGEAELDELRQALKQILGLRNEDTQPIEVQVRSRIEAYKQHLQQYEDAFTKALVKEYPLNETARHQFQKMQQQWELSIENVTSIESRITAEIEAYRNKLQQYEQAFIKVTRQEYPLSDNKMSELRQEQQNLGLKPKDIVSIESRITGEIETYRNKLRQYEEIFTKAIRHEYPLSESKLNELRREHESLGLKEEDCILIKNRIAAEIETYRNKLQQYEQSFSATIQQEYPLSDRQRNELKQVQQNLDLLDTDITPIETRIIAEVEEYLQKLQQYEEVLIQSTRHEYPLSNETREELKRYQCVLELKDEDIARIEQELMTSGNVMYSLAEDSNFSKQDDQPQEAQEEMSIGAEDNLSQVQFESLLQSNAQQLLEEHQKKLDQYEQAVNQAIQTGESLDTNYVRYRLSSLQQTLGLSDLDVDSIKARLVTQENDVESSTHSESDIQQREEHQEDYPDSGLISEDSNDKLSAANSSKISIYEQLKNLIVACIICFIGICIVSIFIAVCFTLFEDPVKSEPERQPTIIRADPPIIIASNDLKDPIKPSVESPVNSESVTNNTQGTVAESKPKPSATPSRPQENVEPTQKPETEGTTWLEDWGSGTESKITTDNCMLKDFLSQGYKFFASSSIPKAKLKKGKDAYSVLNGRATTVRGCWFQKAGSLIHIKWERKHDRKIWEQDLTLENEGIWSNQIDGNGKKQLKNDINERINIVWNKTTPKIRAALLPEQKKWLKQREINCALKTPTGESVSVANQKACMAIMTDERTNVLKQQIAAMEK